MAKLREESGSMEHRSSEANIEVRNNGDAQRNKLTIEPSTDVAQRELPEAQQMGEPVNCTSSELFTYLRALAEGYLVTSYLDINLSVPLKSNPIASKSYTQGNKTVSFLGFPFLQMSKSSTESHGADSLMLCAEDSRVRTSVRPEAAMELTESKADCGQSSQDWLAKYDPDTHSLRTRQCLLFEDSTEFLATLPRWGMMQDGVLWALPIPDCHTDEKEFGFLPTITVCGNYNRKGASETSGDGIITKLKNLLPTICASESRDASKASILARLDKGGRVARRLCSELIPLSAEIVTLNPCFAEWMMGWPIGASALKPLEMDKCPLAFRSHGKL